MTTPFLSSGLCSGRTLSSLLINHGCCFLTTPLLALGQFDFGGNFGPDAHFRCRRQRFRRIPATSGPPGAAAGRQIGAPARRCIRAVRSGAREALAVPGRRGTDTGGGNWPGVAVQSAPQRPVWPFFCPEATPHTHTVRFGPGKPLLAPFGRPAGVLTRRRG